MSVRMMGWALAPLLAGCAPRYALVPASPVAVVHGAMKVSPAVAWNRAPKAAGDIAWRESWTGDGPMLDSVEFIGGLPDGRALARQKAKADRQVTPFRSNMSPQDIVSMIESYYRLRGGARTFEVATVTPRRFLDHDGLQFDYDWLSADEVKRHGRIVTAVVAGRFYMIALDGASLHYFHASLPQFEALADSARL